MTDQALRIGDFRVIRQLGSGGMGIVYLAEQEGLGREVALKVLGKALDSESGKQRFRREARAVAKLDHPSIAKIHYVGQDHLTCYMAMEYVDGISFRDVIGRMGSSTETDRILDDFVIRDSAHQIGEERFDYEAIAETETIQSEPTCAEPKFRTAAAEKAVTSDAHIKRCVETIREAAIAINHAHEMGVIHRDLKPENLMLDKSGVVYVIDFGVALFFEDATLTHTGTLVGTPMYMSPEQWQLGQATLGAECPGSIQSVD